MHRSILSRGLVRPGNERNSGVQPQEILAAHA
jgi:hypothetical protein